jgi:hypothetical protein
VDWDRSIRSVSSGKERKVMVIRIGSRLVWRWGLLLALAVMFLAGPGRAKAQGCEGVSPIRIGAVTWSPQWCQEFNGAQTPPDITVWSFDLGNNHGWGNNELEVYCGPPGYANNPPQCPTMFGISTNPVYIDGNGHLVILPINNNGTWISTRMNTRAKKNFLYGRIEASLKIPDTTNPGFWPAFWSLGSNLGVRTPWPNCGEADFMENWSPQVHSGPGPKGNRSTIHTASTGATGSGGAYLFPVGMAASKSFHQYGVIWSSNMVQFYVDDPTRPFLVRTPSDLPSGDMWPFNSQMFLLMNVAVGGHLGGSIVDLVKPEPMMADYVRSYSPSVVAKPALGNPPSITVKAGATTDNGSTLLLG